jgi:hypothetical protein
VDVSLTATLYRYIDRRQFASAYRIASLSATPSDWRHLASEALLALDTDTARKCYVRLREPKHIDLCAVIDKEKKGKAAKTKLGAAAKQAAGETRANGVGGVATQARPYPQPQKHPPWPPAPSAASRPAQLPSPFRG